MTPYLHSTRPVRIPVPGGKLIEEHIGRVANGTEALSVAHMVAPPGWSEPAQRPTFAELTIMLRGTMHIECDDSVVQLRPGETFLVQPNVRVRYGNPSNEDCEYWAVCLPAFTPAAAQREG